MEIRRSESRVAGPLSGPSGDARDINWTAINPVGKRGAVRARSREVTNDTSLRLEDDPLSFFLSTVISSDARLYQDIPFCPRITALPLKSPEKPEEVHFERQ